MFSYDRLVVFAAYLMISGCLVLIATQARGQQSTNTVSAQQLAKSAHNPFEDYVKVPIEPPTGFGLGPHNNAGASLNIEPLIPLRLNPEWDLIAQPNLTVT